MPHSDDYHGDEHRSGETRGRRQSDQLLDGWTWARVIKVGTAIGLLWGGYFTLSAYIAAKVATRQEMDDVTGKVGTLSGQVQELQRDRALIRAMARLQCLGTTEERAFLADLPCETLGVRPRGDAPPARQP